MTYYKTSLKEFLECCGPLTEEETKRATEAFDKTLIAAHARFLDACHEFSVSVLDAIGHRKIK